MTKEFNSFSVSLIDLRRLLGQSRDGYYSQDRASITRKSREMGSPRECKHIPGFTMRRKRWRRRRIERVCGDNAASRASRNRVISAARPNTCPIILLLPLPATACGDPATKAFLVFDTANCTHPPTLPERPSACPRSSFKSPFFPFFGILSRRNKPRDYRCTRAFERKKIEGVKGLRRARKVAAAIRSQSRRFNELGRRARRTQPFR